MFRWITEIVTFFSGVYLILDSFFFNDISFNYAKYGLQELDPLFGHWILGIILIIMSVVDYFASKQGL